MKVDPTKHGDPQAGKPALTVEDLDNADIAVLTIAEYREVQVEGRTTAVLEFHELPDRVYWLNKSGLKAIVEVLGDDSDAWEGQAVPLLRVRTTNPRTGDMVTRYHVAPAMEWPDVFAEARPEPKAVAKRATRKAKRAAKRGKK